MKYFRRALFLLLFIMLTIATQFGGVVLIISWVLIQFIPKDGRSKFWRSAVSFGAFLTIYAVFLFGIVPITASLFGRVPLPLVTKNFVKPANMLTYVLGRNYVRRELREIIFHVGGEMQEKYPGTVINYLDTGFPFINGFPLWPHLSHNDGKKADISFQYFNNVTGEYSTDVPSWIGYGVCEEPRADEYDYAAVCEQKGFWQYSFMRNHVSQEFKHNYLFDETRTAALVRAFIRKKEIGKILIEPHLKQRLNLTHPKVRLHGCQAVRHDDHVHVQLR
jgi:hypothetical protein